MLRVREAKSADFIMAQRLQTHVATSRCIGRVHCWSYGYSARYRLRYRRRLKSRGKFKRTDCIYQRVYVFCLFHIVFPLSAVWTVRDVHGVFRLHRLRLLQKHHHRPDCHYGNNGAAISVAVQCRHGGVTFLLERLYDHVTRAPSFR